MWLIKVPGRSPVPLPNEVIPMTNDELWKLYENILVERERIKAERRAQRATSAETTATPDPPGYGPRDLAFR